MLRIHSIDTLRTHDGPGIRTVIFLQGCPMKCIYCHNPDMLDINCRSQMIDEENLLRLIKPYFSVYQVSGGGITISGGEPLVQREALSKFFGLLKKWEVRVAIETSGAIYCPATLNEASIVFLDIKHSNSEGFKKITGYSMDNTLKTLQYLTDTRRYFIVRQVIVPGYTDSAEQVRELARLCKGAAEIELLPFHNMGAQKYKNLGLNYPLENLEPPSPSVMSELNEVLTKARLER